MGFGKRPSTAAPTPPPVDPHDRRKVFPDAVWQGATGALLRDLGMHPNDESNLVPNAASINARLEQGKRTLDERTAKAEANAKSLLPAAQLRPFFLIPDPCWQSETGTFLMTSLDLYPYDDWNVVFLAADHRTAAVMDIALHPNGNVPAFITAAEKFMIDARAHMKRATDEVELTQDYAAFADAREDVQLRVKGLALSFARTLIDAWEKQKDPNARSPFSADVSPQAPLSDEEPTGLRAVIEEVSDEAQARAKTAAFNAARSAFSSLFKND